MCRERARNVVSTTSPGYAPAQRRALPTPEGIPLSLEIASIGTRLGAFLLDMLMISAAIFCFSVVALMTGIGADSDSFGQFITVTWLLTLFVLRNFWFILFEMGPRGATPGKRIAGLRVIAREGGRLEARSVVARNLLRDVELFLPLGFMAQQNSSGSIDALSGLLGFGWTMLFLFFPLFNKDRMRAGDLIAGTWVIRAPKPDAGHDLLDQRQASASRFVFNDAHLAAYGAYELQTLEGLLRGKDEASVALVAETIRTKIGWPYEHDDRAFLSAYYAAVRTRLEKGMLFGNKKRDKFDGAL
jgi:uncharacterized RDD family membrane protein YckC